MQQLIDTSLDEQGRQLMNPLPSALVILIKGYLLMHGSFTTKISEPILVQLENEDSVTYQPTSILCDTRSHSFSMIKKEDIWHEVNDEKIFSIPPGWKQDLDDHYAKHDVMVVYKKQETESDLSLHVPRGEVSESPEPDQVRSIINQVEREFSSLGRWITVISNFTSEYKNHYFFVGQIAKTFNDSTDIALNKQRADLEEKNTQLFSQILSASNKESLELFDEAIEALGERKGLWSPSLEHDVPGSLFSKNSRALLICRSAVYERKREQCDVSIAIITAMKTELEVDLILNQIAATTDKIKVPKLLEAAIGKACSAIEVWNQINTLKESYKNQPVNDKHKSFQLSMMNQARSNMLAWTTTLAAMKTWKDFLTAEKDEGMFVSYEPAEIASTAWNELADAHRKQLTPTDRMGLELQIKKEESRRDFWAQKAIEWD